MPVFAVRPRLHLAKAYRANGDAATARHLLKEIDDILVHRPDLGALVDEVDEFRQILTSGAPAGATGGAPLSPAELRLLPFLQTHLTIREIGQRLFVSRNTANSEIRSIHRKLGASSRSDAVRRAMAVGLLGGQPTSRPGLIFQRRLDVIPQRHRQLRSRRDHAGQPDHGNHTDQHVDNLGGGRAGTHRGIGLRPVGRTSAPYGDQRGQAHQRQRLGTEVLEVDVPADALGEAGVVDGQTAQPLRVVHTQPILSCQRVP